MENVIESLGCFDNICNHLEEIRILMSKMAFHDQIACAGAAIDYILYGADKTAAPVKRAIISKLVLSELNGGVDIEECFGSGKTNNRNN